jgi:ribosome-associated protein
LIPVTDHIVLDEDELQFTFVRAGGPGGQNVNKVATAAQLRFDVRHSPSLPNGVKARLIKLAGRRVSREGVLIITAHRFRTQERNRQDAVDRLLELVRAAEKPPVKRRPSRPTLASKERRLKAKRQRSDTKRTRSRPPPSDG